MPTTEVVPYFSFEITGKSKEKALAFTRNHKCGLDEAKAGLIKDGRSLEARQISAGGGLFTFCFTPGSIGMTTVVKCACGKEADVTDYDSM